MSSMNNLFSNETVSTSSRSLSGTAQLTTLAGSITADIIKIMNADVETFAEDIKKSQVDNNAMDTLIDKVNPLDEVDVDFLKDLDEATIDGMLKSQQSKRSRCKSKTMTIDNYRALMTGAVAENLIRLATGKDKQSVGNRRAAGAIEYTIEQLQQLEADQDKLRKEIRNVQSKKSIMKSKADFNEEDERWIQLLKVEQQLKDMRLGTVTEIIEVDRTKEALSDLLNGQDLHSLKATDSKELLARIAELVAQQEEA